MKHPVLYAKLQTEFFTNGTGNLGTTLDPIAKHTGMKMFWLPEGLYVNYKGVHFLVPPGNVVGVRLQSDPTGE